MRLFLSCAVAFAAVFAAIYLGAAFVAWDFHPGRWDSELRGAVVVFGGILGLVAAAVAAGVTVDGLGGI